MPASLYQTYRYWRVKRIGRHIWLFFILYALSAGTSMAQVSSSGEGFQVFLDRGQALYSDEEFAEAETVLLQAVERQAKSAAARYWLGMTYFELDQNKKAEKHLKAAIRNDKTSPKGYVALGGRVYMKMKNRMIDARQTMKQALKYDPNNADAYYYLGISYMIQSARDPAAPLYVIQARNSFQKATASEPQHPDAFYQLALSYEYPARDYKKALSIFYRQLTSNPGHRDALMHLGKCSFLTEQYQLGVDLLHQLIDTHGDALPSDANRLMAQLGASYLQFQKKYDKAVEIYEEYLNMLTPEERIFYTDLSYITSEEEFLAYQQASDEDKQEIWRKFWASRDPDPATVVNERLVEHYRRVMYSREHYGRGQLPWDRRGYIYIRYGNPDDLQHFVIRAGENAQVNYTPTGDARIDAIRERNQILRYRLKVDNAGADWLSKTASREIADPEADEGKTDLTVVQNTESFLLGGGRATQTLAFVAESWVYVKHDLELFFVDQTGHGKFDYPLGIHETNINEASVQNRFHPERMAQDLINRTPDDYEFDYGGLPLNFLYDMVTYKGDDERTLVEVVYTVPTGQLGSVEDGQGLKTWFDSHVVFRDDNFRRIANTSERVGPIERPLRSLKKTFGVDLRTASLSLHAPAGVYNSAVEVRDEASRRIGIFQESVTIPDYTGDTLSISDIKLATSITAQSDEGPFVRNSLKINPNPSRIYERADPVHFYYELYNLTKNNDGRTSYRIELEVTTQEKRRNIVWRFLAGIGNLIKRGDDDQSVLLIFDDEGTSTDAYRYMSIDTGESPTGTYIMTLKITDLYTSQTVSKTKTFIVTNDRARWFDQDSTQSIDMRVISDESNQ